MHKSRAIVLHQIKYSETSLILKIYTEKEGLLSFIAKGVRGKKGKLRSAQFQPLNLIDLSYREARKSELRQILDLKVIDPFIDLPFNPVKRTIAIFIAELTYNAIKEQEPNHKLFEFLYNSIHWIDLSKESYNHFHLLFMMKLTKHLGFYPMLDRDKDARYFDLQQGVFSMGAPAHRYFIDSEQLSAWKQLINVKLETINSLLFSNSLKRKLLQTMMLYYKLHLIHFKELNSHHILQSVFNDE